MTENEVIEWQKAFKKTYKSMPKEVDEACDIAIKALEEIQQYRSIGTVEECREAVERQKSNKPVKHDNCGNKCVADRCPNCFEIASGKYCENCGQAISWERDNE